MAKIIVWGMGQISQVLSFYLTKYSEHEICAYTMDKEYIKENTFNNKPVIPFEEIEYHYSPDKFKMAIMMGYKHLNKYREEKYLQAKAKGYSFISYVSPNSICDAEIGENTFIFNHNDIQPFTKIGNNVVIWAHTAIGHHAIVEDNCFLASPVVSGATIIRKNCFLGSNCTIADGVEIGEFSVIGAGAIVTKSIKNGTVIAVKQTKALSVKSYDVEGILE